MSAIRQLSIIIPVLNEETLITDQIAHVRAVAPEAELIVADGGSSDATLRYAEEFSDRVVQIEPGRARQMNAGADLANGKYLLFLHADTMLPGQLSQLVFHWSQTAPIWGHFSLRLSGKAPVFRVIESMINWRTRMTAGATGDQCQIIRADVFKTLGGFADLPLMEDLAMSRRLRRLMPPKVIPASVESSSRRWEEKGVIRTILLMWLLRCAYTLGVQPRHFYRAYR